MSERRKLKKIRDFLNKNKNWICLEECKNDDPQCELCTIRLLINYAYSVNKSANMATFVNSYLWKPFQRTVEVYEKYKDSSWNKSSEDEKKKIIENSSCCILM